MKFLGWFKDRDTIHIAMEYISYGDLGEYITSNDAKVKTEAQAIAAQILEGLVILHERKICHRDLKPQVTKSPKSQVHASPNNLVEHPDRVGHSNTGENRRFRCRKTLGRNISKNAVRYSQLSSPRNARNPT